MAYAACARRSPIVAAFSLKMGLLALVAGTPLSACGGSPNDPSEPFLGSQIIMTSEAADLAQAVQVDSVFWLLDSFDPLDPEDVLVEGWFELVFRNQSPERLALRYELRFFDADFFLVDRFIPFGQPLVLEPGQIQRVRDIFTIRAGPIRDLPLINLLQIAGTISRPAQ